MVRPAIQSPPPPPQRTDQTVKIKISPSGEAGRRLTDRGDQERIKKVLLILESGDENMKSALRAGIDGLTAKEEMKELKERMDGMEALLKSLSPPGSKVSDG